MITKMIKKIEEIIAERVVDNDMEYFENYKKVKGATEEEIQAFEREFNVSLPDGIRELYRYKDGSSYPFELLYTTYDEACQGSFQLLSLAEIREIKALFFNENKLMEECGDFLSSEDIASLDNRIKPFIRNKRWLPFAQLPGFDLYLMLDYDPAPKGALGQIIIYVHDPDFIYYVRENISDILQDTIRNLENGWYEEVHGYE